MSSLAVLESKFSLLGVTSIQCGRYFQINNYVKSLFEYYCPAFTGVGSCINMTFVIHVSKILPEHIQKCIFEHLTLEHLIAILGADQTIKENSQVVSLVNKIIKVHLKRIFGSELLGKYAVEDIINVMMRLYNERSLSKYSLESLESFIDVKSFDECCKLFVTSPLLILKLIFCDFESCYWYEDLELEILLTIILFGCELKTVDFKDTCLNSIINRCMEKSARSNNVKMLSLLVRLSGDIWRSCLGRVWVIAIKNEARDFIRQAVDDMFNMSVIEDVEDYDEELDIEERCYFFDSLMLELALRGEFDFLIDIGLRMPRRMMHHSAIIDRIRWNIQVQQVSNTLSEEDKYNLYLIIQDLIELGFSDQ